ncbi:MAG: tRNA pseudouridine(38-40) synthase TruA [Eubacteriales bacterium]|nr:tRNA pseudouridine(38-40) synthase TruA [Eubacteriales bacterium]
MPDCRRIALLLEYDGFDFHGFQDQGDLRTVQQVVQDALRDLSGESDLQIVSSSRTDQGVHARGLVCHLDTTLAVPLDRLPLALNNRLPDDVALLAATEVPPGFHARYDAVGKIYTYRYYLSPTRPVLSRHLAPHVFGPVDQDRMREALPYLCGTHDFYAFMDQNNNPKHTTIRTIHQLDLAFDPPFLTLQVRGNGFLYHMVRILAGTVLAVGQGKIEPQAIPQILSSRDRKLAGKTMPPQGLCLESVLYPFPLFKPMEAPL